MSSEWTPLDSWLEKLRPFQDREIDRVELDETKTRLALHFVDGSSIWWHAEGDCCSSSWVEHIEQPKDLRGAKWQSVRERDMGSERDGELKLYATDFITDRGEINVEYRNESNGYYGGWLDLAGIHDTRPPASGEQPS